MTSSRFSRRAAVAALAVPSAWLVLCTRPARAFDLSGLRSITGQGQVVEEVRRIAPFRGVKLGTAARVVLRQADRYAVRVVAQRNVLPAIDTYVDDGILVVEDDARITSAAAQVIVTFREISSIAAGGETVVRSQKLELASLSLSLGGACAVDLAQLRVSRLRAALGGASTLVLGGAAERLTAQMGGSATVDASALETKEVTIDGGGTAQAVVWATRTLSAAVGGSAGVDYYGDPQTSQATSGTATVRRRGAAPPKRS